MSLELALGIVGLLLFFAVADLIVGVSNDAVNFLGSSIGSRVASRKVIFLVASLGIIAGVMFSSGMMEVARKGIFRPQFFTMPELLSLFLAVMLSDILLLDLFNTHGLPTSTTVSIVFELLGAAVGLSVLKIIHTHGELYRLGSYINTGKAMVIIFGILLSVVVAFITGAIVQYITRLIFTFDYASRLKRYGAIWGGVAMAAICFFILIKGAKGATFISSEELAWIKSHKLLILGATFGVSTVILFVLQLFKVNILKPIVLVGTFALAMAFAANDLVNFIGVPLAGLESYRIALGSGSPLTATMDALSGKVRSESMLLFLAGIIMVLTICFSKKARSVVNTQVDLGQQEERQERFEAFWLSRSIVRMWLSVYEAIKLVIPSRLRAVISRRTDPQYYHLQSEQEETAPFDLLRASVNLMMASVLISFATSLKLPLSTTYVTFMVAMGTSFADQAWGRESAVYRISGVLTVVGGWFMTAFIAFTVSLIFLIILYFGGPWGGLVLLTLVGLSLYNTRRVHKEFVEEQEDRRIFNLMKVKDAAAAVSYSFDHMGILLEEIRNSIDQALEGLYENNAAKLRKQKKKVRHIQNWSNIIIANIFKAMRLLQKSSGTTASYKYAQTIRRLQKLSDGHRDIVLRSYVHVSNQHSGLLPEQIEELKQVQSILHDLLFVVETMLRKKQPIDYESVLAKDAELRELAAELNQKQVKRIINDESKTRLTILYYAIVGNAMMLSKQNHRLLQIFQESFGEMSPLPKDPDINAVVRPSYD